MSTKFQGDGHTDGQRDTCTVAVNWIGEAPLKNVRSFPPAATDLDAGYCSKYSGNRYNGYGYCITGGAFVLNGHLA